VGTNERPDRDEWEFELSKALARRLPGLYRELFKPGKAAVLVGASLSVKPWRGRFLAVLRGKRVDLGGSVVCFGAGDTPLYALRNVSAAASKGEFKPDKFAATPFEGPPREYLDMAEPLNGR
jgi:hypothetical protein